MSTDELTDSSTLPPYPEMILSAIEALDDDAEGCSKSWISSYIETKYADHLPDAHPSLLEDHLQRMRDAGEVVVADGGYAKPKPGPSAAPAKRGRGRPPKPRPELPAAAGGAGGKLRGRPPKKPKTGSPAAAAAAPPSGVKRGRGRPPKAKPQFADVGFA